MKQKPQIKCGLCKRSCDAYAKFPCQTRQFCSKECSAKHTSINRKGYKGGLIDTPRGYKMRLAKDHPSRNSRGYVFEHRVIVEKNIKRFLKRSEEVHHINGDKQDNRLANLQVMSRSEHAKQPKPPRRPIKCVSCESLIQPIKGDRGRVGCSEVFQRSILHK